MLLSRRGLFLAGCVIAAVVFRSTPSAAQSRLDRSGAAVAPDRVYFREALERIHKRTGVVIVAEDYPAADSIGPDDLAQIDNATSARDKIMRLASDFDYSATFSGHVATLRKRYTTLADIPCITEGEALGFLENVQRTLAPFDPAFVRPTPGKTSPLIAALAPTLSQAQLAALGASGLPVRSLSVAQRDEVARLAAYVYVQQNRRDIVNILSELKRIETARLAYGPTSSEWAGKFGYSLGAQENGWFLTFDQHPHSAVSTSGFAPLPSDSQAAKWLLRADSYRTTIGQTVSRLNANKTRSADRLFAVADEVSKKTVTLSGLDGASANEIFTAIDAVYGLRISSGKRTGRGSATWRLHAPEAHRATGITTIADAMVVPEPLVRFLSGRSETVPGTNVFAARIPSVRRFNYAEEGRKRPALLRLEAGRLLEQSFLHNHAHPGRPSNLPFAEMSDAERNVLCVALIMPALEAMEENFLKPAPKYVAQLDDAVLRGGPYGAKNGSRRFRLEFQFPNRDGQLETYMGISNIEFAPAN